MEEIVSPADEPQPADNPAPAESRQPVRAYDPSVLAERQPRITDLIPVRPLPLAAAVTICVASLTLVVGLHLATLEARRGPLAQVLAPLDLAQPASLARWLGALWLAAAAGLAILIYRIRVHRADDYQGRYRVWLWAAVACGWLSLDTVAGLHTPVGWLLARLGSSASATAGTAATLAWMSLYAVLFSALGLRLALELRSSKASLTLLALAAGLYVAGAACDLGWLTSGDRQRDALLAPGAPLAAHGLVLWTALWYARHVNLDAAGRLRVHIEAGPRAAHPRRRFGFWMRGGRRHASAADAASTPPAASSASAAELPSTERSRSASGDAATGHRPDAARPAPLASTTRGPGGDAIANDEADGEEHLSRAERRRARRLARAGEQRRAA